MGDIQNILTTFFRTSNPFLQPTERTSIDIDFTDCLNTSFEKSSTGEKMKSEGVSAHQRRTTESGNLGCTRSKSQERKTEEDGKKSDGEKMRKTEEEEANIGNEENLRRWKTNLDTACQGE